MHFLDNTVLTWFNISLYVKKNTTVCHECNNTNCIVHNAVPFAYWNCAEEKGWFASWICLLKCSICITQMMALSHYL